MITVVSGINLRTGNIYVKAFTNAPTKKTLFMLAHEWGENVEMAGDGFMGSDVEIRETSMELVDNEPQKVSPIKKVVKSYAYNLLTTSSGVLLVTNTINEKVFVIGASNVKDMAARIYRELTSPEYDTLFAISKHLWHSFRKYGEENFVFTARNIGTTSPISDSMQYIEDNDLNRSAHGYNHG